eukprot:gene468-735_t
MEYSSDTENSDVTFINNEASQGGTSRAPAGVGGARRRKAVLPRRAWMNDGDSAVAAPSGSDIAPSAGSTSFSSLINSAPDIPLFLPPTQQQLQQAVGTVARRSSTSSKSSPPPDAPADHVPTLPVAAPATAQTAAGRGKKAKQDVAGPCCHCGATSSPQWRKGPKGKPVLCNACGIRFLRNRTLTKVVPKKRKNAGVGGTAKRPKAFSDDAVSEEEEEMETVVEEMLLPEDCANANSAINLAQQTALAGSRTRRTAGAPSAGKASSEPQDPEPQQQKQQHQQRTVKRGTTAGPRGAAKGYVSSSSSPVCADSLSPQDVLAAGSRQLSYCSGGGLSNLMGSNPSLALALALHQEEQKQHNDMAPSSPGSAERVLGASTSPVSHASVGYHHQVDGCGGSSSPPASPLLLSDGNACASAVGSSFAGYGSSQQLRGKDFDIVLPEAAPLTLSPFDQFKAAASAEDIAAAAAGGDILRLVTQIAGMLGGLGPAIDFLKAFTTHSPGLAAAGLAAGAAGLLQ